jgi:hypothetical protein
LRIYTLPRKTVCGNALAEPAKLSSPGSNIKIILFLDTPAMKTLSFIKQQIMRAQRLLSQEIQKVLNFPNFQFIVQLTCLKYYKPFKLCLSENPVFRRKLNSFYTIRVYSKINYQFWELSRLSAKFRKPSHIKYMPCFQGAGGQDESASKM